MDRIIYNITVDNLQAVAMEMLGRSLTDVEVERAEELLNNTEVIDKRDTLRTVIGEVVL